MPQPCRFAQSIATGGAIFLLLSEIFALTTSNENHPLSDYFTNICMFKYPTTLLSTDSHLSPGLNASIVKLVLHIWLNYLTFSYYFIFDRILCFGDFLPPRTLCDAYYMEFECDKRSILDISEDSMKVPAPHRRHQKICIISKLLSFARILLGGEVTLYNVARRSPAKMQHWLLLRPDTYKGKKFSKRCSLNGSFL